MKNRIPDKWTALDFTFEMEPFCLICCPLGYPSLFTVLKFNLYTNDGGYIAVIAQRYAGDWGTTPTNGAAGVLDTITRGFAEAPRALYEWYFDTHHLDEVLVGPHTVAWKPCNEQIFQARHGVWLPDLATMPEILAAEAAYSATWNTSGEAASPSA